MSLHRILHQHSFSKAAGEHLNICILHLCEMRSLKYSFRDNILSTSWSLTAPLQGIAESSHHRRKFHASFNHCSIAFFTASLNGETAGPK